MKAVDFRQTGHSLIMLLVFMTMAMIITTGAVTVTLINSRATTTWYQGEQTLPLAQSGIENAILRLLRDPNYTGETIQLDVSSVTTTVTGGTTKTITTEATNGSAKRKIQVIGSFTNNVFTISSWREIQ